MKWYRVRGHYLDRVGDVDVKVKAISERGVALWAEARGIVPDDIQVAVSRPVMEFVPQIGFWRWFMGLARFKRYLAVLVAFALVTIALPPCSWPGREWEVEMIPLLNILLRLPYRGYEGFDVSQVVLRYDVLVSTWAIAAVVIGIVYAFRVPRSGSVASPRSRSDTHG